jgi:DNA-binding transcriptional regulator LsrR (DeoR family)
LKAAPIYSAIRGGDRGRGYINVLIIDVQVAERLLTVVESYQRDATLRLV